MAEVRRDTALEERLLEAVIADRNAQPRNQQLQVGPSSVGGCRELLRASLFEPETMSEPETHWSTAAHVGTVVGADLERIFGRRLGALEQQRVTAILTQLGISLSGAIDLLFLDENMISDLKSTADMGGVLYDLGKNADLIETLMQIWREGLLYAKSVETPDGGYELTQVLLNKFSKLHYYVQVAIYVVGAMQSGILAPDAEGRLIFYDRGGNFQEFVALILTAEEIQMFFDIGQHRVAQVARLQEVYESTNGNPAVIAELRDMTPSYCFSQKVLCPRRMHCWAGSQWTADEELRGAEVVSSVDRYEKGRDMEKLGAGMKKAARDELKGIQGRLSDGRMVTWTKAGAINVVSTTKEVAKPKSNGERLVEAVKAEGIPVIPGVSIDELGDIHDDRPESQRTPAVEESMKRLRKLQERAAADRTERGKVRAAVVAQLEQEELQQYQGLSFFDYLEHSIDPSQRSKLKHERNMEIVRRYREAKAEAGLD